MAQSEPKDCKACEAWYQAKILGLEAKIRELEQIAQLTKTQKLEQSIIEVCKEVGFNEVYFHK